MSEKLDEVVEMESVNDSNVLDGIDNEIDSEAMPNSKLGGVFIGAGLALAGVVLYKKAVKPGISWVKEKWSNRKSKDEEETEPVKIEVVKEK